MITDKRNSSSDNKNISQQVTSNREQNDVHEFHLAHYSVPQANAASAQTLSSSIIHQAQQAGIIIQYNALLDTYFIAGDAKGIQAVSQHITTNTDSHVALKGFDNQNLEFLKNNNAQDVVISKNITHHSHTALSPLAKGASSLQFLQESRSIITVDHETQDNFVSGVVLSLNMADTSQADVGDIAAASEEAARQTQTNQNISLPANNRTDVVNISGGVIFSDSANASNLSNNMIESEPQNNDIQIQLPLASDTMLGDNTDTVIETPASNLPLAPIVETPRPVTAATPPAATPPAPTPPPTPSNNAPIIATPITDQSVVATTMFHLDISTVFTDMDNDLLTITAALEDGSMLPMWLVFNQATQELTGTPQQGDIGNISIRITADDGNGAEVSEIFDLEINTNATHTGTTASENIIATPDPDYILLDDGDDTVDALASDDTVYGGNGNDSILGNDGDDSLFGDDGNDTLRGQNGNDVLNGGDGNDSLEGGNGNDTFNGGAGNDRVSAGGGSDLVILGEGNDTVAGSFGLDTIYGGDGNDRLDGNNDNDEIDGGAGNDNITGGFGNDLITGNDGDDIIRGNHNDDTIYGNDGNDIILGDDNNDQIFGGNGRDILNGGTGTDTIEGGNGNDIISGDSGNDTIDGGSGSDMISGGGNDDTINGGDNDDTINGNAGTDVIAGGAGNDRLFGGNGQDILTGDAGNDAFYFENNNWSNTFNPDLITDFVQGEDIIILQGNIMRHSPISDGIFNVTYDTVNNITIVTDNASDFEFRLSGNIALTDADFLNDTILGTSATSADDTIGGSSGNNNINALAGNDRINGLAGNDNILGGDDNDTIDGGEGHDTLSGGDGNDTINGNHGNDTIYGNAGDDSILGFAGTDLLYGHAGNDRIVGWSNNDTIFGGEGHDSIDGGGDQDLLYGDDGNDTIIGNAGRDTIYGGNGNDTINGGHQDDIIFGGSGNDEIDGSQGNDSIRADSGDDNILGGSGNDTIHGLFGNDTIDGGDGNDIIRGGWRFDNINGGNGNDTIAGQENGDTITGGLGDDVFEFGQYSIFQPDHITDFQNGSDIILFDNTTYSFSSGTAIHDNIDIYDVSNFSGGSFTGGAGTETLLYDRGDGEIWYDADGAGGSGTARLVAVIDNFAAYTFDASHFDVN